MVGIGCVRPDSFFKEAERGFSKWRGETRAETARREIKRLSTVLRGSRKQIIYICTGFYGFIAFHTKNAYALRNISFRDFRYMVYGASLIIEYIDKTLFFFLLAFPRSIFRNKQISYFLPMPVSNQSVSLFFWNTSRIISS